MYTVDQYIVEEGNNTEKDCQYYWPNDDDRISEVFIYTNEKHGIWDALNRDQICQYVVFCESPISQSLHFCSNVSNLGSVLVLIC